MRWLRCSKVCWSWDFGDRWEYVVRIQEAHDHRRARLRPFRVYATVIRMEGTGDGSAVVQAGGVDTQTGAASLSIVTRQGSPKH
jgi:hypothetical protein